MIKALIGIPKQKWEQSNHPSGVERTFTWDDKKLYEFGNFTVEERVEEMDNWTIQERD